MVEGAGVGLNVGARVGKGVGSGFPMLGCCVGKGDGLSEGGLDTNTVGT